MEHLITPDQEDWKIGGLVAFFEKFDPPTDWDTGINQHVEHTQDQASHPTQNQAQQHAMDAGMNPGSRVG